MTDISKEAVERLAKTADVFASAMKAFQHHTKKHNEDVRDTLRAQSAHIAAQDAKIAKLVEALRLISSHRRRCHEHDEDMGHDLREFDLEDLKLMEQAARSALASIGETDD